MRGMTRREKGRIEMKRTIKVRKKCPKKMAKNCPLLFFRSVRPSVSISSPRHRQFEVPHSYPVRTPVGAPCAGEGCDRPGFSPRPPLLIERSACWAANKPCRARLGSFVRWQQYPAVCSSICPSHLSATVSFMCFSSFF
jgi:hypothetical protein